MKTLLTAQSVLFISYRLANLGHLTKVINFFVVVVFFLSH